MRIALELTPGEAVLLDTLSQYHDMGGYWAGYQSRLMEGLGKKIRQGLLDATQVFDEENNQGASLPLSAKIFQGADLDLDAGYLT